MAIKLADAREGFEHKGNRGTVGAEVPFRDFLTNYLPRSHTVGHGEVIDTHGRRSAQTDVVITDPDHPFTFTPSDPGTFVIEGVAAAGEVKSMLSAGELDKAVQNAARFKTLGAAHVKGTLINASPSDIPRFYDRRPFFLIAFESQLKLETVAERVGSYEAENGVTAFDALFLLDRGWAINFGDGKGAFRFAEPGKGPLTGWVVQEVEEVLFDLLVWISSVMPRFVRFEAILRQYL